MEPNQKALIARKGFIMRQPDEGDFNCLEICPKIGHCCREFIPDMPEIGLPASKMTHRQSKGMVLWLLKERGLPFVPTEIDGDGYWAVRCTALGENGMCTIYATRPFVCRQYQPRANKLCCLYGK